MNIPYNIPAHTGCINCGECCGPMLIFVDEERAIREYIQRHPEVRDVMQGQHEPLQCIFRDSANKRCAIYPVRPLVCRLFGVAADQHLQCPRGNTAKITGVRPDFKKPIAGVQNHIEW